MQRDNYFIDITSDVCPLTFVRTKLLLEKMPVGAIATVRLKGAQPLDNVPRSVRAHGHEVISLTLETRAPETGAPKTRESEAGADDPRVPHLLVIRRC